MGRCGGLCWFGSKRSTFLKTKIGFHVRLYSMTRCGYALKCLALLVRQGVFPSPRNRFWSPNHANKNMLHSAIVRVPWRECGCQEQVSWETWFISTLDDLIDVTELSITYNKLLEYYMTCKIVIIINYMLQALWSPIQQTAIYHTNHILQAPQIS